MEIASSLVPKAPRYDTNSPIEEIYTPNVKTIDDLAVYLKVDHAMLAKSVVYWSDDTPVLVLMMGNDALNEAKLSGVLGTGVRPIEPDRLLDLTGADGGSIGPVGLRERTAASKKFKILADKRLEGANNLISGANRRRLPSRISICSGIAPSTATMTCGR
jgi:prolyl-tRNA synthetase